MRKLAHLYHPTCWCDSLYRTITKFSFFCCFRAMAYIRLWNWVQFVCQLKDSSNPWS